MAEYRQHHTRPSSYQEKLWHSTPTARQAANFVMAALVGATLLLFSGIALTATILSLIVATPVLVIFSPILVPAALVLALVTGGFLLSGGLGVAALSAAAWVYNYVTQKHPVGANHVDYARERIAGAAHGVSEKVREYSGYVQSSGEDATTGQDKSS